MREGSPPEPEHEGEDRRCKEDDKTVGELRRKLGAYPDEAPVRSATSAAVWETP